MQSRPSWDEYFLKVMDSISERSTCDRGKVGCVIVKNNQILATGYADSPPGLPHCDESGHQMEERIRYITTGIVGKINDIPSGLTFNNDRLEMPKTQHCIRTVHGEMNAILQAAKYGISLEGSTVYVRMTPCRNCAMALISIGVKRVVCQNKYHSGGESETMLKSVGISLEFINDKVLDYK